MSNVPAVPTIHAEDVAAVTGTITTRDGRTVPFVIDAVAGEVRARRSAWLITWTLASGVLPDEADVADEIGEQT